MHVAHNSSRTTPHLSSADPIRRFHTDPSGTFVQFTAKAIGSGSEGAQTTLQELYRADLTLKEAETLALSTLKAVMEEKARKYWGKGGGACLSRGVLRCPLERAPEVVGSLSLQLAGVVDERGHCDCGAQVPPLHAGAPSFAPLHAVREMSAAPARSADGC